LRGGFAAAWIIVADEPIEFPRVTAPDILVAQAQDSIKRFGDVLKPAGILIVDSDMVHEIPPKIKHLYKVPATTLARNEIKIAVAANMIMLGALCKITEVVGRQALEQAIAAAVPEGKEDINLEAFNMGFEQVTEL
jgi:2-oxoglutarate ferredoxin oxidoreductase subunit gamma